MLRRQRHRKRAVGRPKTKVLVDPSDKSVGACAHKDHKHSGVTKDKSNQSYRSYSHSHILKVVQYAQLNSESAASRHFNVPRLTIYYWKDIDKEPAEKMKRFPKRRKRKHLKEGSGRPISYLKELDEKLVAWVLKQRDIHLPVSSQDIKLMARKLIHPINPLFKASSGWLTRFMVHHSLSTR